MGREALSPRSLWGETSAGRLKALVVCRSAWRRRKRWRIQRQVQCSIDWRLQEVRDRDLILPLASVGPNSEFSLFRKDHESEWDEHSLYSTSPWQAAMLKGNIILGPETKDVIEILRCHLWALLLQSFILFKCPAWETWGRTERGAEDLAVQWASACLKMSALIRLHTQTQSSYTQDLLFPSRNVCLVYMGSCEAQVHFTKMDKPRPSQIPIGY